MSKLYTLEEVEAVIQIVSLIDNQVGSPDMALDFLKRKVPQELHGKIIAACMAGFTTGVISSLGRGLMTSDSEPEEKQAQKKDISEMTSEELDDYINQKLKGKK